MYINLATNLRNKYLCIYIEHRDVSFDDRKREIAFVLEVNYKERKRKPDE